MDDAMVAQSMTQLMTHRRQNSAWTQCEPLTSCNGSSMKSLTPPPPTKTTSKPERQASHQPCPLQSTSETVVPGATPFDRRLVVQGCSAAGNERQRMEARLRTARNVQHVKKLHPKKFLTVCCLTDLQKDQPAAGASRHTGSQCQPASNTNSFALNLNLKCNAT